jgi:hypothetical protein
MSIQDELDKASMLLDAERQQVVDELVNWVAANASKDERRAVWRDLLHYLKPAWAPDWTAADSQVADKVFLRLPADLDARIRKCDDRRAD